MTFTYQSGLTVFTDASSSDPTDLSVDVGSETHRLLVVLIFVRGGVGAAAPTIDGVTFNGDALTARAQAHNDTAGRDYRTEIWSLAAPDTGGAHTLSVNFSGTTVSGFAVHAVVITSSTAEIEYDNQNTSTGNTDPTVDLLPNVDNCILIGGGCSETNDPLATDGGGTVIGNRDAGAWVHSSSYVIQTTAATHTLNWTGTDDTNAAAAASFKEAAGGGTEYPQAVAGTLTTSGTVAIRTGKVLSGALSSSGAAVLQVGKVLSGALSSSGALSAVKIALVAVGGTLSSSGALVLQVGKAVGGTLSSSGAAVLQVGKVLSGALSSSGALVLQTRKVLGGTLSSSGALSAVKTALISLGGTLSSSGAVVLQVGKALSGTLSSSGALSRSVNKALSGTLTTAGELIKRAGKVLSGLLGLSGDLGTAHTQPGAVTDQITILAPERDLIITVSARSMTIDAPDRTFILQAKEEHNE